ncbi:MAG: RDD family protein [Luteimonas sp.]
MTEWYYADASNTRQGPITMPALLQLRQQGTLGEETLLWRDGLDGWMPLRTLAHELGAADPSVAPSAPTTTADGWALEPVAPQASEAAAQTNDAWRPVSGNEMSPPSSTASDAPSPYTPPAAPVARAAAVVHGGDVVDAGFLKRAAALFLDSLLVTAIYYGILIAAMVLFGLGGALGPMGTGGTPDFGVGGILLMVVIYLAWPVVSALYYVLMESSSRQATLGKMAVGIKVTGLDGGRIGRGRAFGRWASHLLAYVTLCIAYLVALFTDRKQGLHDLVAGTYVVDQWAYTDHPERQQRTLGTVATVILVLWATLLLLGVGLVVLAGIAASF